MASIIDILSRYIRPYYYYVISIVLLLIFLYIAYYAYNKFFVSKQVNKFTNVANANRRNKDVNIYLFHVDWCPHCKKALPDWNDFKSVYNNTEVNGYIVKCIDINCTEETAEVANIINSYGIESYPTIKMVKDQNTIEFDSKITKSALEQFVNMMTSN
jgi:thiol-disulfide isomerase/thioredoxin